mgnify:CR=1 FL=1
MLLEATGITASYGDAQALFGMDFKLEAGEVVALIGANGAGKSTFLKTLTGLLPPRQGSIRYDGHELSTLDAAEIVKLGIAMVPEGRRLFPGMTVQENLAMGAAVGQSISLDSARSAASRPWSSNAIDRSVIGPALPRRRPRRRTGGREDRACDYRPPGRDRTAWDSDQPARSRILVKESAVSGYFACCTSRNSGR